MAAVRHLEFSPERAPSRPRHLHVVPRPPLRTPASVYRRRRLVVGVVVAGLLVVALRASAPGAPGSQAPAAAGTPPARVAVHVVKPGDTYWSIAASLDRPGPLLEAVDALVAANGGEVLQPGDRLVVPG